MKNSSKRFFATLSVIVFLVALFIPFSAGAQSGTLGTVVPAITCSFRDANGTSVDGNNLAAGEYDVDFVLSEMACVSAFQITASYEAPLSSLEVTHLYSDDEPKMLEMGVENLDGNLIFGVITEYGYNTTEIDANGTVIATLHVVIDSACDFENVFHVSTDPEETLFMADYEDGEDSCYVLDTSIEFEYDTYPMTCDVSPPFSNGFDVTGQITIATELTGASTNLGVVGITVSVTAGEEVISATTDENGYYTLHAVPANEYTMSIAGETTIDRNVTLNVSADKAVDGVITVDPVGIVVCDYTHDGLINSFDKSVFNSSYNKPDAFNVYCDLTGDKIVNSFDKSIFNVFYNHTVTYDSVTL